MLSRPNESEVLYIVAVGCEHIAGPFSWKQAKVSFVASSNSVSGKPVEIKKLTKSRGFELPEEEPELSVVYRPTNFKWDSSGEFLYFTTLPWSTRCMLWQVKVGKTIPRAIVPLWNYRLLKKGSGPDWVEAYETNYEQWKPAFGGYVRDWKTTYIVSVTRIAT